jgi:hypothetical protein
VEVDGIFDFLIRHGYYAVITGVALAVIGYLLLIIVGFRTRILWGVFLLLFPPAALVFLIYHYRRATIPICFFALSGLVIGSTYAAHFLHNIDRGPRERVVAGETHLTLTGWDGGNYEFLASKPDTVVLQMANADVTNETLRYLKGMINLNEADLSSTQVTDEGLELLKHLPNLRILRLKDTRVTDDGFRTHLFDKASLLEIDLRGTRVTSQTLREWKAKDPMKRKYLR